MAVSVSDVFGFLALWALICMHINKEPLVFQVHKTRPASPAVLFSLIANGWIWGMYGLLDDNFFPIGTAGVMTVVLDGYYAFLLYNRTQDKPSFLKILGGFSLFLVIATTYGALGAHGHTSQTRAQVQQIVGDTGVLTMLLFLSFQFKTITEAVKHRSNDGIPTLAVSAGIVNATMWIIYSVRASTWLVFVPNVVALLLAIAQIVLYLAFGHSDEEHTGITEAGRENEDLEASTTT